MYDFTLMFSIALKFALEQKQIKVEKVILVLLYFIFIYYYIKSLLPNRIWNLHYCLNVSLLEPWS